MIDPRIDTIRKALIRGRDSFPFGAGPEEAFVEALAALAEVEAHMMPEVPEGYFVSELSRFVNKTGWACYIWDGKEVFGEGPTACAALRAAIANIECAIQTKEKP